jgi:hypothetical protein
MFGPHRSDRNARDFVRPRASSAARHPRQAPESGQATTEFALILLPLLLIVAGIIQFGIALNYWLDMQRVANQGARWAAVDNWPPECAVDAPGPCTNTPACDAPGRTNVLLQNTLKCQALTQGLQKSVTVEICYPANSGAITEIAGNPVRVRLDQPFDLLPILGWGSINLRADATMRLEQSQEATKGLITQERPC